MTKWPEVFAVKDQTMAQVSVEQKVPLYGVPSELLSDRGAAFLSKLMEEVYLVLGVEKVTYHPQIDGLFCFMVLW